MADPQTPPPRKPSRGCITALVVVLVLIGLLIAVFVPFVREAQELANRAGCSSNLSCIGRAGEVYAKAHKQQWPKIPYEKGAPWNEIGNTRQDQLKAGEKPPAAEVQAQDVPGRSPESNTANLWVLIGTGCATPALFYCPSTDTRRDDTVTDFAAVRDCRGPDYVSYSLQNCWGEYRLMAPSTFNAPLTSISSTNATYFAIAADANPQRADFMREGGATKTVLAKKPRFVHDAWSKTAVAGAWELNSPNHNFKGQNVLYLDSHVDWTDNPWCGINYDNIWVTRKAEGGTPIGDAASATLETLRSWDDGTSYDGKKTLPADSVDDSFLVP